MTRYFHGAQTCPRNRLQRRKMLQVGLCCFKTVNTQTKHSFLHAFGRGTRVCGGCCVTKLFPGSGGALDFAVTEDWAGPVALLLTVPRKWGSTRLCRDTLFSRCPNLPVQSFSPLQNVASGSLVLLNCEYANKTQFTARGRARRACLWWVLCYKTVPRKWGSTRLCRNRGLGRTGRAFSNCSPEVGEHSTLP